MAGACGDRGVLGAGECVARLLEPRLLYEAPGCRFGGPCVRLWLSGGMGDGSPLLCLHYRGGGEFVACCSARSVRAALSMVRGCRGLECLVPLLLRWRRVLLVGWGGVPGELLEGLECVSAGGLIVCLDRRVYGPYIYGLAALAMRLSSPGRVLDYPAVAGMLTVLGVEEGVELVRAGDGLEVRRAGGWYRLHLGQRRLK